MNQETLVNVNYDELNPSQLRYYGILTKDGRVYESLDSVLKEIDSLVKKIEENPKKYIRLRLL